ncbi:DMT family transporter [Synechococcus sp. MIT S9503]|uniref:DMT family transporter n=1 Tax=Synechococcus sp. MIT S9503 TaxID=3082547 RepID=UPI0039A6DEFA
MTSPNPWLLLLLAISAEVIGTSCLKLSQGFSRPLPTLVVLSAYAISMTLMSRVVQVLPMGLTYALWSGIGIVAIVLIGLLVYRQVPTQGQLIGMALITAGVVTVNLQGHPG